MNQETEYQSVSDLPNLAEEVGEVESGDYINRDLIPVGTYLSQERDIKAKRKDDGTISFEISFTGGITNPQTGQTFANSGGFPLRTWVSTKKFSLPNRPGQTSSVAQYLRALGLDPKAIGNLGEAIEMSQTLPVAVFVGWTNRGEKLPDGSYEKEVLKTRDFNQGSKDEPNYVATIVKDGKAYEARHRVQGFRQIK